MSRGPTWTPEELDVLRREYLRSGAAAVHAALPHRSMYAIYGKAHSMGLNRAEAVELIGELVHWIKLQPLDSCRAPGAVAGPLRRAEKLLGNNRGRSDANAER